MSPFLPSLSFSLSVTWYMPKPESTQKNETHKILGNFEVQTDHKTSTRRPDLVLINKKRRSYHFVDFSVLADHRRRRRKKKKKKVKRETNTWALPENWKKLRNMRMTVIPIVVGAPGTVSKGLEKRQKELEIRGRIEIIEAKTLLRSARILSRVLEIWGDLLSLKLLWKANN